MRQHGLPSVTYITSEQTRVIYLEVQRIELARILNNNSADSPRLGSDVLNNNSTDSPGLSSDDVLWLRKKVARDLRQTICSERLTEYEMGQKHVHFTADDLRRRLDFYHKSYQSLIAVATSGGGFTFTVIFANIASPREDFTTERVKQTLAIAWLLFTLSLIWATVITVAMAIYGKAFSDRSYKNLTGRRGGFGLQLIGISFLLGGAFLALAQTLRMYEKNVEIAALLLVGLALCYLFGVVFFYHALGAVESYTSATYAD